MGDGDGCNDMLQHFGFNIVPQVKVGAVFYALLAIYAKPELEFPFRLTMPESDGPKCGRSSSFDLCANTEDMMASYSIDMTARFFVGFHLQSVQDMIDRLWTQVTQLDTWWSGSDEQTGLQKWSPWLEWMSEYQIGGDVHVATLAEGCFDMPDLLETFNSGLCCDISSAHSAPAVLPMPNTQPKHENVFKKPVVSAPVQPRNYAPPSTLPYTVLIDLSSRTSRWLIGAAMLCVAVLLVMNLIRMARSRSDGRRSYTKVAYIDSEVTDHEAQAINVIADC